MQEADPSQILQSLRCIGCLPLAAELDIGFIEDFPGFLELSQKQQLGAHEIFAAASSPVRSDSCEERFRLPAQLLGFGMLTPHLPHDGFELDHPSDVDQAAGRTVGLSRASVSRS